MAKTIDQAVLTSYDEGISALRHIEILAGLLAASGQHANAEPVDAVLVADAGEMICAEAKKARTTLATQHKFASPEN